MMAKDEVEFDYEGLVRSRIAEYGFMVQKVAGMGSDERWPQFAYTVGLTAMGHPEILCHGLPLDSAQSFLIEIGDRVRNGSVFSGGMTTRELTRDGLPLTFIEATDTSDLVVGAMIYGSVRALQLVWPDPQGRFPWEPGCIMNHDQQPLRGRTTWPRPPE
jgi:hypothetical protein